MERVRDDNDVFNVIVHDGLINSALNGKELSFSIGNIDSSMKCFDDRFVIGMYVRDGCSDLIFDASIQYNNGGEGIVRCFDCDFLQVTNILFCIQSMRMKRNMIWININDMTSRFEFMIKKEKRREKVISFIIHIDKRRFQSISLFSSEMVNRHIMS